MPLPRPTKAQTLDPPIEGCGVAFALELDGRTWQCFIMDNSLDRLYYRHRKDEDRIRRVEERSYLSVLVAERIRSGMSSEPIVISSLSAGPHAVPCPLCGQ
jgi:hypothetical protein